MINTRQYELLKELKTCSHYVPLRHFAEKFSCSEKTISTDLKALNLTLSSGDLETQIETKTGNGVRLLVRKGEESALENVMLLNVGSAMTSFDRFYRGVLYLAQDQSGANTLDSLAAYLYTNRRRVQMEIRHWNNVLSFFCLTIKSKKGSLSIEGSEHALRVAILYFFYMITPYYQHHVIEEGLSDTALLLSEKLLNLMQVKRGVAYADNARSAFCFYIDLMAARIKKGHPLEPCCDTVYGCDDGVAEEICAVIAEALGLPVAVSEANMILSSHVMGAMSDPHVLAGKVDAEAKAFTHALRDAVERTFGYPLDVDTAMALESLTYQALQRMKSKFPISLFNAAPMKRHHVDWLITLEDILNSVPDLADVPLFADDVARIAMLLYPYGDKHRKRTYRALLVADASFEQALYGVHCVEENFPFVRVVEVASGAGVSQAGACEAYAQDGIDFIIAFDPLSSSLPVCQISHAVDEDDLMHLMKFVLELEEPWQGKPFEISSRVLNYESVHDIAQAVYWDMSNEGIVKAPFEEFVKQFRSHCAISTEYMTTVLCLKRTSTTGLRVYKTPSLHVVQPITSLSVLHVAEDDRMYLNKIVARFNRAIRPNVQREHAYGMPPYLNR